MLLLLLAVLGGTASLFVSYVSVSALNVINPAGNALAFGTGPSVLPASWRLSGLTLLALNSIRVDSSALLFTFATVTLAAMLFGLAPAWQAARTDVSDALKKTDDQANGLRFRGKAILVVVEIALAFILLTGAGLAIKSLSRLMSTPIGINAENVLTVRLGIPTEAANPERIIGFFEQLEERVAVQAGVVSAALGSCHALAGFCGSTIIWFRDRPEVPRGTEPSIGTLRVSPSYFATMKIPLIRGRLFTKTDRRDAPKVVVISETTAHVVRHEVRRAAALISAGMVLGVSGALAATQILEGSLYEVRPHDPQTYVVIAVLLAGVALLASYVPARRASVVDPAITLRTQ